MIDTTRVRRFLSNTLRVPLRPPDPRRGPNSRRASYPLADFNTTAESYADRLPYLLKVDATTAVTRDLGYTRTFRVRGKDLALASLDIRNSLNDRINGAWKGSHDGWMWHTHLDRKKITHWPIKQTFPDTASWLVAEESRIAFEAGVHHASEVYWTVTYLAPPDKQRRGDKLIYDYAPGAGDVQSTSAYEARKTFEEGLSNIVSSLRKDFDFEPLGVRQVTGPHAVPYLVDDQLSFQLLCATGKRQDVRAIPDGAEISEYIADTLVQRDERLRVGDVLIRPLTIVDFPDSSTPFILDVLDQIPGTFMPSWRWIGRDPAAALKEIKKRRGRSLQKRSGMASTVVNSPNALVDPEQSRMVGDATHAFGLARSGQVANGWFSFVVTSYEEITEDDRIAAEIARRRGENITAEMLAGKRQDKLCDEITGSLRTKGFIVSSELDNALDAFLGSLPSDGHDNVVRGQLNTRVLANWIPTTHVWQGEWRCTDPDLSPDLGPLAIFQTNGATPFALNLHYGKRGGNTLIVGEPGSGKALDVNTEIVTPDGPRRFGDLQIGDQVFGSDGRPTTVIGVFPQGRKEAYRVTFCDGTSTVACGEHLWAARNKIAKARHRAYRVTDTLSLKRHLDAGHHRRHIPIAAPLQWPRRELPLDPYLLGALIGDGTFSERDARFTTADADLFDEVERLLPTGTDGYCYSGIDYRFKASIRQNETFQASDGALRSRLVRNTLSSALDQLGLLGKRSFDKAIPPEYLYASPEQRLALLQGLFDTDGSAAKSFVEFSTSSKQLAKDVAFLVQSLGGLARTTSRISKYQHAGERREGRVAYRMSVRLPAETAPFRLHRKLAALEPRTKYADLNRTIVSIEPEGHREMMCIAVDAADHLYLANDCIVTHNTTIAGYLANRHRGYGGQQIFIDNEYQHWVHCVAVGGTHVEVMPTGEFGLAPFAHLDDDDEFAWCQSFIKLLCAQAGYTDASLAESIYLGLVALREGPPENRTMTGFLASYGVSAEMRAALMPFTRDGLAGNLFDTPTQSFDGSSFTVFEISTLGDDPTLRKPALIALMHTIERMFKTRRPSMVVTEELWELLEDPIATGIVVRWVKMSRRKGACIVLLTQSIEDLDRAPKPLLNACVTRIVMPNEGAIGDNAERFRAFGLESWERHQLAALAGRNTPLVMQPGGRRFVDATLGPVALATVGQSSTAQIERAEQFMAELEEHWYPDFVAHHFQAKTEDEKRVAESWRRHAYFGPERIADRKLLAAPQHAAPHADDVFASEFARETTAA